MTQHQDPDPDKHFERHADFQSLNDIIATGIKTVLAWIIPPMLIGVGAIVLGYFEAKQTKLEVEKLNARMEATNEKVMTMWFGGDWPNRYRSENTIRQKQ